MVIYVRLVTGCSWEDAEHLCGAVVSDTTARARRDEWIAAGVLDAIAAEAIAGFDKIVGLELAEVGIDGSAHKAPVGGEGTGKSPVDRGKLGWTRAVRRLAAGQLLEISRRELALCCIGDPFYVLLELSASESDL